MLQPFYAFTPQLLCGSALKGVAHKLVASLPLKLTHNCVCTCASVCVFAQFGSHWHDCTVYRPASPGTSALCRGRCNSFAFLGPNWQSSWNSQSVPVKLSNITHTPELAGWLAGKNSLTNCLSQAASREHDSRQFMWQLPLSGRALSPKTAHSTHSAPPDHDVNELGHQVWEE